MRKFITSLILVLGLSLPLLAQPKPYKIKPIKFASRAQKAKGIRVDLANIEMIHKKRRHDKESRYNQIV